MSEDTTKPAPEPGLRRAWGLAAASLVCGVASLVLALMLPLHFMRVVGLLPQVVTVIAAIVCGHWALRFAEFRCALAGRKLAYASLILVPTMFFVAALFGNTGHRFPEKGSRINCAANLKQIGLACMMYASDYDGAYPPDWSILWDRKYLDAGMIYVCPSTKSKRPTASAQLADPKHCDYVYFGAGQTDIGPAGATTVLAADRTGNHKRFWNVVFGDGHVGSVTAAPGTDFATAVRAKGWGLPGAGK